MRERPVSVLASVDASGVVVLSVCGAYRLITIDLRSHRSVTPTKKGRSPAGGRCASPQVDSPSKRRHRKAQSPGPGAKTAVGAGVPKLADGDAVGAVRPLQLQLSSDLSLLSALVEVDGHIELVQASFMQKSYM